MKKKLFVGIALSLFLMLFLTQCAKTVHSTTGSINGIVTDANSGEPVFNATITLSPSGKTISTGTDGAYEFVEIEPLQYKIQAMHPNYKTNTKTVTVIPNEIVRGDMQMTLK